ncbi:MAG: FecR domain-containing protein [Steroidobacteraceae bacterium]
MERITEDRSVSAISERAAEWFLAQREKSLSLAERQEFVTWLQASPIHVREYLAIAGTAQQLATQPAFKDDELRQLLATATQDETSHGNVVSLRERMPVPQPMADVGVRRPWRAALAASLLVGVVAAGWSWHNFASGEVYEVAGEGQGVWRLSDGSIMHLNAHSAARVRFSDSERRIELQRGEAMFEVAHQARRKFRVNTGFADVVAVGTRFEVLREPQQAQVTVVAGIVSVAPSEVQPARVDLKPLLLKRGQRLVVGENFTVGTPETISPRQMIGWAKHEVEFDRRPLASVVNEFNRYTVLPIQIQDADLRQLPISGIFNAYDSESLLQFLRRMEGVEVVIETDKVRVERAASSQKGRTTAVVMVGRSLRFG